MTRARNTQKYTFKITL